MFKYGNYQIRNQSRMPACTSAASKPEKNLSSDQVAPDSSIPMCRRWKDSQQPNRVSTSLHAIREHLQTEHLRPEDSEWCHSRGTTVKATKEEGKHHHGVWMQCKALQSELSCREMFVFGWRAAQTAGLFGSSSFHLIKEPSTQCRNPTSLHICVFIISISLWQHVSKYFKLSSNNVAALYSEWHRLQVRVKIKNKTDSSFKMF